MTCKKSLHTSTHAGSWKYLYFSSGSTTNISGIHIHKW